MVEDIAGFGDSGQGATYILRPGGYADRGGSCLRSGGAVVFADPSARIWPEQTRTDTEMACMCRTDGKVAPNTALRRTRVRAAGCR